MSTILLSLRDEVELLFADDEDKQRGWIVTEFERTLGSGKDVQTVGFRFLDDWVLSVRSRVVPIEQLGIVAQVFGCEAQ